MIITSEFSSLISFPLSSVDLCHPLLVGVLSDKEEDGEGHGGRSSRREVFLRVTQHLVLEVDTQRGRERCRLELGSLARVETTEAAWTRGVREERVGIKLVQRDAVNLFQRLLFDWSLFVIHVN